MQTDDLASQIPDQPTLDIQPDEQEDASVPNLGADLDTHVATALKQVEEDAALKMAQLRLALKDLELQNTQKDLALIREEIEIGQLKQTVKDERTMLKQRKRYASRLFDLSCYWLLFIGASLLFAGKEELKVSDPVLIALITTTTLNVLGLFYIVARWLFPNKYNTEKDPTNKSA
jgi:hypothetical protein